MRCAIFKPKIAKFLLNKNFFGANHYYYFHLPIGPFHWAKSIKSSYSKSRVRQPSKKYSVCVTQPTVFLDKKNTKIWVGESESSNIRIFENFRIMPREKTATNNCLQSKKLSINALLISISFYPLEAALAESIIQ